MNQINKVELLAPAGNSETFYGVISAGADAVYLAGNKFGARAYADNFSPDELNKCIRYAHLFDKKVYLTVNTLVKEQEISQLDEVIYPAVEAGLDAVIVQDFGVLNYIKKNYPHLDLHASTQMSISSSYGAKYLKSLGATRIVPSREMSLNELKSIKSTVDIELETFIHGAMCYCYSGQCLFSSILGGRSGNRGKCAQPCRLPYKAEIEHRITKEGYYLSLKDMCTIEKMPYLLETGIHSFKVEGRMKKPEYAAGVISFYRKYIDLYYMLSEQYGFEEARKRYLVEKEDKDALNTLYIRSEIQDGYYFKQNGKEMLTITSPAYNKTDETLLINIRKNYLENRKKLPVSIDADFTVGYPAKVTVQYKNLQAVEYGDVIETAQKQPISKENIMNQLTKLGDSSFACENITVKVSSNAFYPLKKINELRRVVLLRLEEIILSDNGYGMQNPNMCNRPELNIMKQKDSVIENRGFTISLETEEQLSAFIEWYEKNKPKCSIHLYCYADLILSNENCLKSIINISGINDIYLSMPYVLRENDLLFVNKIKDLFSKYPIFKGLLIRSVDQIGLYQNEFSNLVCHFDSGIYIWNNNAIEFFEETADQFCIPYELNAAEQWKLLQNTKHFEKIVYSRIPMMITANCIQKTTDKCYQGNSNIILKDRYEKEFPVKKYCAHCYNVIYNSVPLSLYHETGKWEKRLRLRIDFTVENKSEVLEILDMFLLHKALTIKEYTTGHEKRGVE